MNPTPVPKVDDALRCGILGAAKIAPPAIILPARTHPEFIIAAVAARSKEKAELFAQKHSIKKVYSGPSGYQGLLSHFRTPRIRLSIWLTCRVVDMLDDKDIDVIYNPVCHAV